MPEVEEAGLHVVVVVPEVTERVEGQFAVSPVEGVIIVFKVTFPLKLPIEARVMVEIPVAPELKSAGEVADKEKLGDDERATRTVIECEIEVVLPVMVNV